MIDNRITDTPYYPDDTIAGAITSFSDEVELLDVKKDSFPVSKGGMDAYHRTYTAEYRGLRCDCSESFNAIGMNLRIGGNLGMASCLVLRASKQFGVPTQIYSNRPIPMDIISDPNFKLTSEWYSESAIGMGLPNQTLRTVGADPETNVIEMEQVEQYAQLYFKRTRKG